MHLFYSAKQWAQCATCTRSIRKRACRGPASARPPLVLHAHGYAPPLGSLGLSSGQQHGTMGAVAFLVGFSQTGASGAGVGPPAALLQMPWLRSRADSGLSAGGEHAFISRSKQWAQCATRDVCTRFRRLSVPRPRAGRARWRSGAFRYKAAAIRSIVAALHI
jgi:hypothetical protein